MGQPLVKTVVRHPGGSKQHEAPLDEIRVPNLWHIIRRMQETAKNEADAFDAERVLECWHLCHDLLKNLRGDIGTADEDDLAPNYVLDNEWDED